MGAGQMSQINERQLDASELMLVAALHCNLDEEEDNVYPNAIHGRAEHGNHRTQHGLE